MSRLQDKRTLVTGGTSGIGLETACTMSSARRVISPPKIDWNFANDARVPSPKHCTPGWFCSVHE